MSLGLCVPCCVFEDKWIQADFLVKGTSVCRRDRCVEYATNLTRRKA